MRLARRLCVVLLNYKTPQLTLDCIDTLCGQLDWGTDHIVVVDNHSEGDDVERITRGIVEAELTELVTLVEAPANNGFSYGNNIGIMATAAKYYLLANSDILFRAEAIQGLLQAAEKYPDAGIVSPRLEWPDGEPQVSCFHFHTPLSEIISAASTGIITRILKKYNVPLPIVDQVTRPEWTSFACVLIRQEVFDRVGLLDEGYFMYFEDVDYCRRVWKAGFEVVNWPFAHVVHLRGQSSGVKRLQKENKRLPAYHYLSRARYYSKFYGRIGYLLTNICWLAGRTISLSREFFTGNNRVVPEYQYLDIWKK